MLQNAYLDIKKAEKQIQDFSKFPGASQPQCGSGSPALPKRTGALIDVFDAENDMRNLDNEYLGWSRL